MNCTQNLGHLGKGVFYGINKRRKSKKKEEGVSTIAVKKAYNYIKDISINFSNKPGTQINETEVAKILGMSRVPVREALNRLTMNGLVVFDFGKGFFCRKFSESEMKDLYEVRSDLEIGAVKRACALGDDDDIRDILEEWGKISDAKSTFSRGELITLDEQFHINIALLCENTKRIEFLHIIFDKIKFLRKIHVEKETRRNAFVDEHLRIIKAILKHDEELALHIMLEHLGANSQELKENIITGMLRIYKEDIA